MRDEKSGAAQWGEAMDKNAHVKTYGAFLKLTKWSVAAVVLILVFLALFLV